jgi:hypothetical protein
MFLSLPSSFNLLPQANRKRPCYMCKASWFVLLYFLFLFFLFWKRIFLSVDFWIIGGVDEYFFIPTR